MGAHGGMRATDAHSSFFSRILVVLGFNARTCPKSVYKLRTGDLAVEYFNDQWFLVRSLPTCETDDNFPVHANESMELAFEQAFLIAVRAEASW